MEMPAMVREEAPSSARHPLSQEPHYQETHYRWAVVALTSYCLLLNGLVNNAVAPIEHKMTLIYSVSEKRVGFSVILSFLVFFIANFPANKIIDKYGMRISLCLGTGLFFIGTFCFLLINLSYNFVILGTVFVGLGQPFLLNSPAKVATLWFFPKNVCLFPCREPWRLP